MAFEIVWEPGGVYKRFWGTVTIPEFIDATAKLHGDARFGNLRYVIHDYRDVKDHEVSEQAIAGIAAVSKLASATNPNFRIAIVTTDKKITELAWQFASRTLAFYPTEIFSTLTQARDWIQNKPPLNRKRPLAV